VAGRAVGGRASGLAEAMQDDRASCNRGDAMNELFDWLDRLEALAVRAQTEPVAITEHLHRVFAPSRLDFDEFLVRVEDGRQEAYAFGALPGTSLSWLGRTRSRPAEPFGDQAIAAQIGGLLTLATNRRVQVAASDIVLTREGQPTACSSRRIPSWTAASRLRSP